MAQHYSDAGKILDKMLIGGASMKSLLYSTAGAQITTVHALVCETLKYKRVLDVVLRKSGIYAAEKWIAERGNVVHVMLYDLLIGKGISGAGKLKKTLVAHEAALKAALAREKVKAKVVENIDLVPAHLRKHEMLPRYARINQLRQKKQATINQFKKEGYKLVDVQEILQTTSKNVKIFAVDPDVCNGHLLVFPPFTDLHAHPLVVSGGLILQDKASCFSGFVLAAPPGCTAIDSCAAPGMKTSQICESMKNKGKLIAFDKSPTRCETLVRLGKRNGMKIMVAKNEDFLKTDPTQSPYSEVEYILCDPSCSGSGIVSRMDDLIKYASEGQRKKGRGKGKRKSVGQKGEGHKEEGKEEGKEEVEVKDVDENLEEDATVGEETEAERLNKLAEFQESVVLHALSFPKVKRVVYSTCSVNQQENENVVVNVLKKTSKNFKVTRALPQWKRRGTWDEGSYPGDMSTFEGIEEIVDNCVRTKPEEDRTIGFFVACFDRIGAVFPVLEEPKEEEVEEEVVEVVEEVEEEKETKKKAVTTKKQSPKKQTTPKKQTPKKQTPKKATPQKTTPEKPAEETPVQAQNENENVPQTKAPQPKTPPKAQQKTTPKKQQKTPPKTQQQQKTQSPKTQPQQTTQSPKAQPQKNSNSVSKTCDPSCLAASYDI
eukprot:TRINITY_DN7280_c0_g1_i4.p1 TRINITY_DN7280_c0_g1~~TRINITY_DN7280_c0_g1_i4.p1  ORF type:complete len:658 (+),score=203.43 TRINITY_DN7280_c0_g1_i4:64-2037(+)